MKHDLEVFVTSIKELFIEVKKSSALLIALMALAGLPFWPSDAGGKEAEFLILHTNNVTGHFFPCPT